MNNNTLTNTHRAFLPVNTDLFNNPRYKKLSNDAKLMYSLYEQRQQVSQFNTQNGNNTFIDNNGVFIYFSNEEMANILNISLRKITTLRKELINCGLIVVKRAGLMTFKIYVHQPELTPANVDLVMSWSNFNFDTETRETVDDKQNDRVAKFASTDKKNLLVNQSNSNQSKNISKESNESTLSNAMVGATTRDKRTKHNNITTQSLDSLTKRMNNILTSKVTCRVNVLAQGEYTKAKQLFDIIFKAKAQVAQRLEQSATWMYEKGTQNAITFENNGSLINNIESALLQITEIMYKSTQTIKNKANFMYVYLRNCIAKSVSMYLNDNYALNMQQKYELNALLNFSK